MARPKANIDLAQAEKLAQLQCTDEELAAFFGVTTRTIENHRKHSKDFREAIEKGKRTGLISLRRAQFGAALKGNPTMLIWLGKNHLGQKDKISTELSGPEGAPISFSNVKDLTDEQLGTMLAQLEGGTRKQDPTRTGETETPPRVN